MLLHHAHIQVGKNYTTTYADEILEVMVTKIIPNTHEQRGSNNLACECVVKDTGQRMIRRVDELKCMS